jgi:hypothetical protein
MGSLVEVDTFSQWHRHSYPTHYAHRQRREVDIVGLDKLALHPTWTMEIRWLDQFVDKPKKLKSLLSFARKNELATAGVTTKMVSREGEYGRWG